MSIFRSQYGGSNLVFAEYFSGVSLSDDDLDKVVKLNLIIDSSFTLPSIIGNDGRQVFFKLTGNGIAEFFSDDPEVTIDGLTSFTMPAENAAVRLVVDEENQQYHILSSYGGGLTEESSSSSLSSQSSDSTSSSSTEQSETSSLSTTSQTSESSSTEIFSTSSSTSVSSSSSSTSISSSSSTVNQSTSSETSSSSSTEILSTSSSTSESTSSSTSVSSSSSSTSLSSTSISSSSSTEILSTSSDSTTSSSSSLTEGSFDQSDILLWYRSDADVYFNPDTTLATDGQSGRQWKNQVSDNYHLVDTDSSRAPVFTENLLNGKPGLVFDGASDFLWYPDEIPEIINDDFNVGRTLIYVYNADDTGAGFPSAGGTIVGYKNTENPIKEGWDVYIQGGGDDDIRYSVGSGVNTAEFIFYNTDSKGAVIHDNNNDNLKLYVQGEERLNTTDASTSTYTNARLSVGGVFNNGGGLDKTERNFKGTLYEIMLFRGPIGEAQLESVYDYIDNKYNLFSQTFTSSQEFSSFTSSSNNSSSTSLSSSSTSSQEFSSFTSSSTSDSTSSS